MVARCGMSCKAAVLTKIRAPFGVPQESRAARSSSRAPPGHPGTQGVIVLTVKLFGETLKTPRTLAVR